MMLDLEIYIDKKLNASHGMSPTGFLKCASEPSSLPCTGQCHVANRQNIQT